MAVSKYRGKPDEKPGMFMGLMMNQFYCPFCKANLNRDNDTRIEMRGRVECDMFSVNFRLLIPSGLGVYNDVNTEGVTLKEGAMVDIFCPHCGKNWTTEYNSQLAEIEMVDDEDKQYAVVFHKVYGEHVTVIFDVYEKKMVAYYGEHADNYINEFGKDINFFGS